MRKLNYLIAGLFMAATIVSCDKEMVDDNQLDPLSGKKSSSVASTPVSEGGVTPYIIKGANRGGNRTCAEVGIAFKGDSDYFGLCGDKIDYENGVFESYFPDGLEVTVDGKFVSFTMNGCIAIDGKYYKVGAVIVKGGNSANIYFYEGGSMGDTGLAAPKNASGGPAGLSNLTFCFVGCAEEEEELIIALKSYYKNDATGAQTWTATTGTYIFSTGAGYWCNFMGINDFPGTSPIALHRDYNLSDIVGEVTVSPVGDEITIDLNDGLTIVKTWLYIGTEEDLKNNLGADGCPDSDNEDFWIINYTTGNTITIPID